MDDWPYDAYNFNGRVVIGDYYVIDDETGQAITHCFNLSRNKEDWALYHCHDKIFSKNFVEW